MTLPQMLLKLAKLFVVVFSRSQEAKTDFRELLKESIEKIKAVAKKLGNSIDSAKPYYEARLYASQVSNCHHRSRRRNVNKLFFS